MNFDSRLLKKLALLILIAGLASLFFFFGLQEYLTLEFIKTSQERFQEIYSRQPVRVIALFVAFYIPVIALNLPGATILGLAAGALFGALTGTVIISFASTIGATLACLLSRYLFRDWVQKKFRSRLERINEGIRKEGAFYLFSMRLIPVIPFFVINM
ncbi:MAG: TVP38/TMEM64 family protein, partial [Desulfotignum sp.]